MGNLFAVARLCLTRAPVWTLDFDLTGGRAPAACSLVLRLTLEALVPYELAAGMALLFWQ